MIIARIIGTVVASQKDERLEGKKLLIVRPINLDGSDTSGYVVAVDTVGAGDTFCGYLAAGLASGLSLAQALRRAAAAGSLACLKPGAQPAIPLANDVDAALKKSG